MCIHLFPKLLLLFLVLRVTSFSIPVSKRLLRPDDWLPSHSPRNGAAAVGRGMARSRKASRASCAQHKPPYRRCGVPDPVLGFVFSVPVTQTGRRPPHLWKTSFLHEPRPGFPTTYFLLKNSVYFVTGIITLYFAPRRTQHCVQAFGTPIFLTLIRRESNRQMLLLSIY